MTLKSKGKLDDLKAGNLKQAISYFGSQAELARRVGCDKSLVTHWKKGRRKITAETAIMIEELTESTVLREILRPDLFKR